MSPAKNHFLTAMAILGLSLITAPEATPEPMSISSRYRGVWDMTPNSESLVTLPANSRLGDVFLASGGTYNNQAISPLSLVLITANNSIEIIRPNLALSFLSDFAALMSQSILKSALSEEGLITQAIQSAMHPQNPLIQMTLTGANITPIDEDGYFTASWDGDNQFSLGNGYLLQSENQSGNYLIEFIQPDTTDCQIVIGIADPVSGDFNNGRGLFFLASGASAQLASNAAELAGSNYTTITSPLVNEVVSLQINDGNHLIASSSSIGNQIEGPNVFNANNTMQPVIYIVSFGSTVPSLKFRVTQV